MIKRSASGAGAIRAALWLLVLMPMLDPHAAVADIKLPTHYISTPGMPIEFIEAEAYQDDDKRMTLACVGFIDHSPITATALKLRYFQLDAFGDVQTSNDMSITGEFSSGVPIRITRALNGQPNGNAAERCYESYSSGKETRSVVVRLEKVLFSDGSVWTSPLNGLSTPLRKAASP